MKGVIHKVYCDMYKTDLTVCFHKETYKKRFGHDGSDNFAGCVIQRDGQMHIYLEKTACGGINVASCAHEAFHVADFIADRVGLVVSEGTGNEHMAYLIGWITNKIFDCLDFDNKMEEKRQEEKVQVI